MPSEVGPGDVAGSRGPGWKECKRRGFKCACFVLSRVTETSTEDTDAEKPDIHDGHARTHDGGAQTNDDYATVCVIAARLLGHGYD